MTKGINDVIGGRNKYPTFSFCAPLNETQEKLALEPKSLSEGCI